MENTIFVVVDDSMMRHYYFSCEVALTELNSILPTINVELEVR